MESVEVGEPGRASLLTLMLKQILDRTLKDPRKSRALRGRVLTVRVRTARMKTTLFFEVSRVRAEDGAHGRPDLEVSGEWPALLSVSLGASPVRALFGRAVRVRPRSWKGWICAPRLMALMQPGRPPAHLRLREGGRP